VGVIAHAAPVHGTQDHGPAHAQQDYAEGPERVVHGPNRRDPTAAQGVADGRGHITSERRQVKGKHGRILGKKTSLGGPKRV
jgi:hypothetical protein